MGFDKAVSGTCKDSSGVTVAFVVVVAADVPGAPVKKVGMLTNAEELGMLPIVGVPDVPVATRKR